ncbi:MAG: hypothetical protein KCHDKBKB_03030 [Elusimicrobia bacterium]|nr:hypothetical protein [Elusimicrobiota bacterium]
MKLTATESKKLAAALEILRAKIAGAPKAADLVKGPGQARRLVDAACDGRNALQTLLAELA